MYLSKSLLAILLSAGAAHYAIIPVSGTGIEKRTTSCTFTDATSATEAKKSCPTITLDDVTVPAGQTLGLTGLSEGNHASCPCNA